MPQAAWEALFRDAVQGLRPPIHPPNSPPMAPGHPSPGLGQRRPPPHPTATTPGTERARARGGQGAESDTPARGHGSAQGDRHATIGTGHRGRHNVGAGNHPRARKGREQGPGRREKEHRGGHQEPPAGRAYHDGGTSAPRPRRRCTTPGDGRPQHTPPKRESDAIQITSAHAHQPPDTTQGREGTPPLILPGTKWPKPGFYSNG